MKKYILALAALWLSAFAVSGQIITSTSGTVDNAGVVDAVNTDPAAVQRALGVDRENNIGMQAWSFLAARKNLVIATFGDSWSTFPVLNLSDRFPRAGGYCNANDSLNVSGGTTLVTDNTVPGMAYANVPNGGTRRFGVYDTSAADKPFLRASKFRLYYKVQSSGTNTLKLRYATGTSTSFADITGHTAVNMNTGTAGNVAVYEFDMSSTGAASIRANYYRIDAECTAGTSQIVGIEALEDVTTSGTRESMRVVPMGLGGTYDTQWSQITQANWSTMLGVIKPHIIVFAGWPGHITPTNSDMTTALDRIRTAAPNSLLLLVGSHPTSDFTDPDSDPNGQDAALKAYAETYSPTVQFADIRRYWPSYNKMRANITVSKDAGTDLLTCTDHELQTGDAVTLATTAGGFTAGTTYYVIRNSSSTFYLATSLTNAALGTYVNISASASDTLSTPFGLIQSDGVHLTPTGVSYQNALLRAFVRTVDNYELRMDLSTPVRSYLPGFTGTIVNGHNQAAQWFVTGDLRNTTGDIGFRGAVGTGTNLTDGPTFRAFDQQSARLANGYALGNTPTNHQLVVARGNENYRMIIGNLGNAGTALTRDPSARVEVLGNGSTEPAFTVTVPSGQSANGIEMRTAGSVTAAGSVVAGFNKTGRIFGVVPAYANDAAADADADLPSGGLYTITGARTVFAKP